MSIQDASVDAVTLEQERPVDAPFAGNDGNADRPPRLSLRRQRTMRRRARRLEAVAHALLRCHGYVEVGRGPGRIEYVHRTRPVTALIEHGDDFWRPVEVAFVWALRQAERTSDLNRVRYLLERGIA